METHRLALPKGFRLSNYELHRVLGKGGFGITYLGVDRHLGRKVAVKELLPDNIVTRGEGMLVVPHSEAVATNWNWAKERFMEEARVLASFKHPNIVEVHQLVEANGTVYMVMEYIEGESYEDRLRRIGQEPDEQSLRMLLEPILDGLEEVHNAGLLHRDIKPDNILLRRGVQPILLDFGSARKLLEGTAVMTSLVTHGYSPIEQYQVKGKQGPWTDIYAMGAVAVRAITGAKPPMSADRMSEDDFVWLSYRGLKDYSPLFLQAIDWSLRVKPAERPQNVAEWRASLGWPIKDAFRSKQLSGTSPFTPGAGENAFVAPPQEPVKAGQRQFGRATPATRQPSDTTPQPTVASFPRPQKTSASFLKSGKGKMPAVIAGAALLAAATIAGGWLMLGSHSSPPPSNSAPPSSTQSAAPDAPSSAARKPAVQYTPFVNSLGMQFAPVPGTNVLFCIWDTRIKDYRAFVQETGRDWHRPDFPQEPDHPAVNVNWEDAKAFCQWLSAKEGREYRLPTDAEWSLAVGLRDETGATPKENDSTSKAYPWGTGWPPPKGAGNYAPTMMSDSFEKTSAVGSFAENRFGLYDMSGNVWQWCEDYYDKSKRYRVLRGGAWNSCTPSILLSSFRYYLHPAAQADNVGFRCVTPAQPAR